MKDAASMSESPDDVINDDIEEEDARTSAADGATYDPRSSPDDAVALPKTSSFAEDEEGVGKAGIAAVVASSGGKLCFFAFADSSLKALSVAS